MAVNIEMLLGEIEKKWGGKYTKQRDRRFFLEINKDNLQSVVSFLKENGLYHLSTITGVDSGEQFEVLYHLDLQGEIITIRVPISKDNPQLSTITNLIPGAVLYEREVQDILGIKFLGHPDPRRLILPDDWPEGVYPLRKDWKYDRASGVIK